MKRDLGRDRLDAVKFDAAVCDHCGGNWALLWNDRGEIACGMCQAWLAKKHAACASCRRAA